MNHGSVRKAISPVMKAATWAFGSLNKLFWVAQDVIYGMLRPAMAKPVRLTAVHRTVLQRREWKPVAVLAPALMIERVVRPCTVAKHGGFRLAL